jgi:hypothetical protein
MVAVVVEKLEAWLEKRLLAVSEKSTIAEAIRYRLTRWEGLVRFLDDGRIEMDTNCVERAMRPIALNRKKQSLRWPRRRRGQLGVPRIADRNREAPWHPSASLPR